MSTTATHDFDRRAGSYDAHAAVQRQAADWLADWLPERCKGPALELGAGTGLFTRHLAHRVKPLLVTDVSPAMTAYGQRQLPELHWGVSDAASPPDGSPFRWIFSCSLAQWLSRPEKALRAWHHAASTDGRLLAGWFIGGTLEDFYRCCPEAAPFKWRNEQEWLELLCRNGWQPLRHESRKFHQAFPSTASMLRAIHNTGAVVPRRFSPGQLRDTLRRHDATHRGPEGLTATFHFLRVEALRT